MNTKCAHEHTMKGLMRFAWPMGTCFPQEKRCLDCGARQTLFGTWQRPRCPISGCKNRTEVAGILGGARLCSEHNTVRADVAREQWVDPATLRREVWTGAAMLTGPGGEMNDKNPPCGACGHPRWAHAAPGMFDGLCCVPECVACDGKDGHAPGYQPSVPRMVG